MTDNGQVTTPEPEHMITFEQIGDAYFQRWLGHRPFILVQVSGQPGATGALGVDVETGGGVTIGDANGVAELLEYVAEGLRANADGIAAAAREMDEGEEGR